MLIIKLYLSTLLNGKLYLLSFPYLSGFLAIQCRTEKDVSEQILKATKLLRRKYFTVFAKLCL